MRRLLIKDIAQAVQVCSNGELRKVGVEADAVSIFYNASIVIGSDGRIEAIGSSSEIEAKFCEDDFERVICARGRCVLPGFVDPHTHPCFAGDRVHEFDMKLRGASYLDIHRAGGGIHFTVRATREASRADLEASVRRRFDSMLCSGTTLVECKSGYGLNLQTEVKMLEAIHHVSQEHPIDTVLTFLGAHSVPQGSTMEETVRDLVDNQLPNIATQRDTGVLPVKFVDVFHEKGVFETEDAKTILSCARDFGFDINFHGDEIHPMGSAELAASLGAVSVSHCEQISDNGIQDMVDKGVFGILLPTTAYLLRLEPPPARRMIDAGVPIALGSDFNPNAHCFSMPRVMNLACVLMRMTMNEALVASTINAAASLGCSATHGSIEVGKVGDLVILDSPRWEHLIYQFEPPISCVIKDGVVVWESAGVDGGEN